MDVQSVCEPQKWWVVGIVLLVEWWFGKTKLVKENSMLAFLISIVAAIIVVVIKQWRKDHGKTL